MTQTVQTNGVQPLSKTWELSLYELQRTPQVVNMKHWHVSLLCSMVWRALLSSWSVPIRPQLTVNMYFISNVYLSGKGGDHRWTGDRCVPPIPAQWTHVSDLSGHVKEHNDHQRMSAPLLCWLYHHSFEIWVSLSTKPSRTFLFLWALSGFCCAASF